MNVFLRNVLCGSLLCLGATAALATPITLISDFFDVTFDNVMVAGFGQPSLVGNALFFTPTTFKTQSLNGLGLITLGETINLQIVVHSGYHFSSIDLSESGDYKLRASNSSVDVGGTLDIADIAQTQQIIDSISSTTTLSNRDGINHDWSALASINLDFPAWADVQTLDLNLTNTLDATTFSTDTGPKLAFIEKKFVGLNIVTSPDTHTVPEGQSWIILLTGLVMMAIQRRFGIRLRIARKSSQQK